MFRNPVTDLIIVAVVALLILGPKRLPMLGRSLGQGLREFKEGITGEGKADDAEQPALNAAAASDSSSATSAGSTGAPPPAAAPSAAPAPATAGPAAPQSAEAGAAERSS
ncbi:MAG TPA: twin-arginine translocase TatA/TatE family subunit [Solirubrobacteraceae bacterium]|nr:twin-arginine translocase TatA/TatE family subunit [Solirubrobacteraceae bacterium]